MSWLRSAVHRAVEASGGRSSLLTRTVRTSLDTVVHHAGQAVAGGARLITGHRNYKSVKVTAKRLEEAALSYKGEERVQLLRRWLVALKETQRAATAARRPPQLGGDLEQAAPLLVSIPLAPALVSDLYVDCESGAEPMNFFHVFLYSQGLECAVLSMVSWPISSQATYNAIVLHYRMCLSGGKDVHNALLSSVKELARLFSHYQDEVLAKRSELLQFAQGAVSGLKINAEIARLDNEISQLQQQINSMDALRGTSNSNRNRTSQMATEVGKLKVLSESLANSSAKTEKRIVENRLQKEESLIFRVTKTNEVSGIEKELVAEISVLEEQRDKLEAELKKEDELSRSIASCKVEGSTVIAWISFLEDTWKLQSLFEELKEKQANEELNRCGVFFVKLIKHHVSACLEELGTSIDRIKTFVDNLNIFGDRSVSAEDGANGSSKQSNPRKYLEEEYLQTEKKVVAAFSLIDSIRAIYSSNQEYYKTRKDEPEIKNLFDTVDKLRVEFESVPRPVLEIEIKEQEEKAKRSRSLKVSASPRHSRSDSTIAPQLMTRLPSESESELAKFEPEYKADEISGWEFDDLEDEPRPDSL
nr:unnamed protein product [Digitaria exilis]